MAEVGRPAIKTPEIIHKIEEAAAIGATIEEIAFYIGVARGTLYRWMQEDSELKDRIEELQQKPILKARQTIVKSLDDPQEAKWYLEKKMRKEFGASVDITSGGEKIGNGDPELAKQFDEYRKKHLRGDTGQEHTRLLGEQQN